MGDRYTLFLKCADCGKEQEAYYAESSGFISFRCEDCKKINLIEMYFKTRIITEKEKKEEMKAHGFF